MAAPGRIVYDLNNAPIEILSLVEHRHIMVGQTHLWSLLWSFLGEVILELIISEKQVCQEQTILVEADSLKA